MLQLNEKCEAFTSSLRSLFDAALPCPALYTTPIFCLAHALPRSRLPGTCCCMSLKFCSTSSTKQKLRCGTAVISLRRMHLASLLASQAQGTVYRPSSYYGAEHVRCCVFTRPLRYMFYGHLWLWPRFCVNSLALQLLRLLDRLPFIADDVRTPVLFFRTISSVC